LRPDNAIKGGDRKSLQNCRSDQADTSCRVIFVTS
jgi:hypothetical protein